MKREFCLLAHDYDPLRHNINGWHLSEKLDGQRALWLPRTRGLPVAQVPFANRGRDSRDHVCTGLWSRYGKVIHAPDSFLDQLPRDVNLDGELWKGRNSFQTLSSAVRKLVPIPSEWQDVRFVVFDAPDDERFWAAGTVSNPNFTNVFSGAIELQRSETPVFSDYTHLLHSLPEIVRFGGSVQLLEQVRLPFRTAECTAQLERTLAERVGAGAEGLIARCNSLVWSGERSHRLVKIKPELVGLGTVVGTFEPGKGKLKGLMGALWVCWNDVTFKLSGFTDEERRLSSGDMVHFKQSDPISFSYRELTDGGIPKEARYRRVD